MRGDEPEGEPIKKETQHAIWDHYYGKTDGNAVAPSVAPQEPPPRRLVRKLTKKQRLVEILRAAVVTGRPVALGDLARRSGLSPHHVSAHMTHLVHEQVAQRIGRGHFILAPGAGKTPAQIEAEHAGSFSEPLQVQQFVVDSADPAGARQLFADLLDRTLKACREVEMTLRYTPTEDGTGELTIQLRGIGLLVPSKP